MTTTILRPTTKPAPPLEAIPGNPMGAIRITFTLRAKGGKVDPYEGFLDYAEEVHHVAFRNDNHAIFTFNESGNVIRDRAFLWASKHLDLENFILVEQTSGLFWRNTPIDEPF